MSTPVPERDPSRWPEVVSVVRPDPAIESAVSECVATMTLEQKVGQMVQPEILAVTPEEVREHHIGSILNGGGSWPNKDKRATAADWTALADAYYDASVAGATGIPVLWGTDAVHGHSNVFGATLFPHNIGLGAACDPELIERIGEVTAREVAATGVDWTFAPTLAVVRDDRWGRTYEGYSEDPEIVKAYGGRMVDGLQGRADADDHLGLHRVLATAKHFLADGGTTGGIDQGDTVLSEAELIRLHAQGYRTALAAGAQTVMASFSSWNGSKMHGSRYLLTDVLRGRLGFDGLVVGDWNGHGQLPGCTNEHASAAIIAGVDLIMVPFDWKAFIANTIVDVRGGVIPLDRIDQAVARILRVKMRAGLLGPTKDRGRPSSRPLAGDLSLLGSPDHRAVARDAVRKSLVLLKNRGGVLPLRSSARVLVAGKGAHDVGLQSGGWTLTWQGTENQRDDFPGAQSIFEGIREAVAPGGGSAVLSADGSAASDEYDVCVVVVGETPYAEGQGDIPVDETTQHALRNPEDLVVLETVRRRAPDVPVVTVFLTGRPLCTNRELNRSDAFVVAWLPGSEGGGVADVLFGTHPFVGRLTFSWPDRDGVMGINRGDDGALFAYGYGLVGGGDDDIAALPEEGRASSGRGVEWFGRGAARGGELRLRSSTGEARVGSTAVTPDGAVRSSTVDGRLQGSAKRVMFIGDGTFAVVCEPRDLRSLENGSLVAVLRGVDTAEAKVGIGDVFVAVSLTGTLVEVRVPLRRFIDAGADLSSVIRPFVLQARGTVDVDGVRWEP